MIKNRDARGRGAGKPLFRGLCAFGLLCACLAPVKAQWHEQQRDLMGTRVSTTLWHADAARANACNERIFAEIQRIDALMSTYREDSEISEINRNAVTSAVEIGTELARLIERSIYFSKLSHGAFDITYASVGYAYDYRAGLQPGADAVEAKLPAIDYRHIELDGRRIRFAHPDVRIDLGGIAKGYAVDRAMDITRACGIQNAMISAGGDSRILGDHGGRPWIIGIRHPRDPDGIALRVPLADSAISTSGDYERFFLAEGDRVHHIIDPATGRSAEGSWSATVIGPDAMTTDALSTTIFILGAARGLALIETLDEFDAIVIDSTGKVHYSSGLEAPETDSQ
jgi:thiamine biosynthesis lipoprotein